MMWLLLLQIIVLRIIEVYTVSLHNVFELSSVDVNYIVMIPCSCDKITWKVSYSSSYLEVK